MPHRYLQYFILRGNIADIKYCVIPNLSNQSDWLKLSYFVFKWFLSAQSEGDTVPVYMNTDIVCFLESCLL